MRQLIFKFKLIIKSFISGNYCYFFWVFPIKKNKVHVTSFYGKGWGDNIKYITENFAEEDVEIVWAISKKEYGENFPNYIKLVPYNSVINLYHMATSKVWLDNCRKVLHPPKRKGQFYFQLWHGGVPLKRIERDAHYSLSEHYIYRAKQDSKMADFMLSNSTFKTEIIKRAFWYSGEILEFGIPKIDIIANGDEKVKDKVNSIFGLKDKKIILYAPTFRNSKSTDIYKFDFKKVIKMFEDKFNYDFTLLVRLHPNISDLDNFIHYTSDILNASKYDDMQELLLAADILITDYSGVMFEYLYTYKPAFLYVPDLVEYKKERGTYLDLEELPFPIAETEDLMISNIASFDQERYESDVSKLMLKLGMVENKDAALRISSMIIDLIKD